MPLSGFCVIKEKWEECDGGMRVNRRTEGRVIQMDLLRIVACVMVIVIHVVAEGMPATTPGTFQWVVLSGFSNLCRAAVPVFFMLSGMFARSTDWKKCARKAIRYLLIYALAAALYQLWFVVDSLYITAADSRPFLQAFGEALHQGLLLPKYHLWFLPEYIAILLLSPVLHAAFARVPALCGYASALFVLGTVIPRSLRLLFGGNPALSAALSFLPDFSLGYLGYYILGRWIGENRERMSAGVKKMVVLLGVLSLLTVYVLTDQASSAQGSMNEAYYDHFFICILLEAAAWVMLLFGVRIGERWHAPIRWLADRTFGVYLTHLFVIEATARLGLRSQRITTIIGVPLKTALVFALCCALGYAWDTGKRVFRRRLHERTPDAGRK